MLNKMLKSSVMLMIYAIIGTGLVAGTYIATKEKIAENEKKALLESIGKIIDSEAYNNPIDKDFYKVKDAKGLGTDSEVTIYRARKDGANIAAVIKTEAPGGYAGAIKVLVGINADQTLAGVRVLSHNETPGLGTFIEENKTYKKDTIWIKEFKDKSLKNPAPEKWAVKKDGGEFDEFSGATITPRAVVGCIKQTLIYFQKNQEKIFSTPSEAPKEKTEEK